MKKCLLVLLAIIMLFTQGIALAEPEATIDQEIFVPLLVGGRENGYIMMQVTNNSPTPIHIAYSSGDFYGGSNQTRVSTLGGFKFAPVDLLPNETAFMSVYSVMDGAQFYDEFDYYCSFSCAESPEPITTRYPAECALPVLEKTDYRTVYTMMATLTNNTDAVIVDPRVSFGVYDAEGNLMYADEEKISGEIAPGASQEKKVYLTDEFTAYWLEKGIVPSSVRCLGYPAEAASSPY